MMLRTSLLLIACLSASPLLHAAGLDTTWNGTGQRSVWFDLPTERWDEATDAVLQPDGKVVVVGFARKAPVAGSGDTSDITLTRLTASGALDASFAGGAGKLSVNVASAGRYADQANAVALDTAGRIYVAGQTETTYGRCGVVLRYASNGTLDTTYGNAGKATLCDGSGGQFVHRDIAIDAQGRAVVVGTQLRSTGALNDGFAARLTAQGQLDASFTGGNDAGNSIGMRMLTLSHGAAYDDEVVRVKLLPNGDLLLAGSSRASGNDYDFMLYKLNPTNGALVPSFGNAGKARLYADSTAPGKTPDLYDRLADVAVLPDGRIRMAGNCRWAITNTLRPCVIAVLANGAMEENFSGTIGARPGVLSTVLNRETSISGSEATSIAVGPYGSVWLAGTQDTGGAIPMQMATQNIEGGGPGIVLPYVPNGSWINAMLFDPQGRAMLFGGAIVDTAGTDIDQATVRAWH